METAHEIAVQIAGSGKEGVRIYPESLEPKEEPAAGQQAEAQPQGAIPEGTVLGDGHIKFVLARIDSRLLHGQVATAWTKTTQPNRIIVVSDSVAHDDLRKKLIHRGSASGSPRKCCSDRQNDPGIQRPALSVRHKSTAAV